MEDKDRLPTNEEILAETKEDYIAPQIAPQVPSVPPNHGLVIKGYNSYVYDDAKRRYVLNSKKNFPDRFPDF